MLCRKREGSLQRRVALLLLLGVINLPVQEALAAYRDAQAMNPARAAMVISANRGFGVTPRVVRVPMIALVIVYSPAPRSIRPSFHHSSTISCLA